MSIQRLAFVDFFEFEVLKIYKICESVENIRGRILITIHSVDKTNLHVDKCIILSIVRVISVQKIYKSILADIISRNICIHFQIDFERYQHNRDSCVSLQC